MGEYATRKEDDEEVKIGTCQSMYYIRYEDRFKVSKQFGSLDPAKETSLFWRLPFPDEDEVLIGEYTQYNRGYRLYKPITNAQGEQTGHEDFPFELDPADLRSIGIVQLTHESGLLVNMPCYHGTKLPEAPPGGKVFWNGKSWFFELISIKNYPGEIRFVVQCRHCQRMWSFPWEEVQEYIQDKELKRRLESYIT